MMGLFAAFGVLFVGAFVILVAAGLITFAWETWDANRRPTLTGVGEALADALATGKGAVYDSHERKYVTARRHPAGFIVVAVTPADAVVEALGDEAEAYLRRGVA